MLTLTKLINPNFPTLKNSSIMAYSVSKDSVSRHLDASLSSGTNSDTLQTSNYLHHIIVSRQDMRPITALLKLHSLTRVTNAIDITTLDNINYEQRFNVTYQFQSTTTNTRYTITTRSSESAPLLSLQSLYPAFNWTEREVWDMYGVFFIKHPDLRRILTDYGFVGFPLRKDFPLSGFREVQFEDSIKQVEYSNAELTQSYRLLSFDRSWSANG